MDLLADPQVWVSFLTLVMLEIVLGIDNIIILSVLVERLPKPQRGSARILGLGFAMLTRIALLFSITWLATLRDPLFRALGTDVSGRDLILFAGGLLLIVKAVMELRDMLKGKVRTRKPGGMNSFLMIVIQIGIIAGTYYSIYISAALSLDLGLRVDDLLERKATKPEEIDGLP